MVPVIVSLLSISVLTVSKYAVKEGVQENKKRKKIRHCDVWLPQIVMTIIETTVNFIRFFVILVSCLVVLDR